MAIQQTFEFLNNASSAGQTGLLKKPKSPVSKAPVSKAPVSKSPSKNTGDKQAGNQSSVLGSSGTTQVRHGLPR